MADTELEQLRQRVKQLEAALRKIADIPDVYTAHQDCVDYATKALETAGNSGKQTDPAGDSQND